MPENTNTKYFLEQQVQYQQVDSIKIAYRVFGQGEPLFFIHGWPLSSFTFRNLIPYLQDHFACYLVDLPGVGESEWDKNTEFTFSGRAKILKALIDKLGLKNYSLLGQNTGATTGRQLALIDHERITKLMMTNTEIPGHRPPWIPLYRLMMFLPGTNLIFRQIIRSNLFVRSPLGFGGCFANLDLLKDDFKQYVINPIIQSHHRMVGQNLSLRGIQWSLLDSLAQDHAKITMPVLLIWGEDDPTFPIDLAREMVSQFTDNAELKAVPNAKLLVHEEQPELVSKYIIEFMQ